MDRMPTLLIGRKHRRVSRADFDAWRLREREQKLEQPTVAALRRAARHTGAVTRKPSGSVMLAALAMKRRQQGSVKQHAQSYDESYDRDVPTTV